ncbi:hypothetical protein ATE84_2298 [Aquimarina sp. MAR_2010_214]|uniref:hypothetical protein n=1 Tax=Aquimarina sp. MAR_2010_214 TaxID=1250026 RepID=UPI000C709B0D|nr:hypothetical protein [Aquimarina sp. MAR_2010_214]PKV50243.1 hypothetical protein ATE84_2298 [Aquimarina sp. MAR_2010_214]
MMDDKDRKKIIKNQYKKGLIPDDLIDQINDDIETYLKKESEKNQKKIEKMISNRLNRGLDIYFSEDDIIRRLGLIYG